MTANRKINAEKEPVAATGVAPAEARDEAPEAAGGTLKNIALFFAAPFIGLAYMAVLPFIGAGYVALLAWHAGLYRFAPARRPPAS